MENTQKTKNTLKYTLIFNAKNVIVETEKMILYKLNETHGIWLPLKNLWLNKIKTWEFELGVYENDTFTYRLVKLDDKSKFTPVTLNELTQTILKNINENKTVNVKVKEKELTTW